MRIDYKKQVTKYIEEANYDAIVELGKNDTAKVLKYIQMNIWGDYRQVQRWHALMALAAMANAYAKEDDETYRNVIRRALWALQDEGGNVPWAAPEMMAVVIKANPSQYREFAIMMLTNGLDNEMCHLGALWSMVYLGEDFLKDFEPRMDRVTKLLDSEDAELRGTAAWALKRLQYEPAFDKINAMADDDALVWIFEKGVLEQRSISQIVKEG